MGWENILKAVKQTKHAIDLIIIPDENSVFLQVTQYKEFSFDESLPTVNDFQMFG